MYKSAVNLGAAGHDPVRYMQDGGPAVSYEPRRGSGGFDGFETGSDLAIMMMRDARDPRFFGEQADRYYQPVPLGDPYYGEHALRGAREDVGAPARSEPGIEEFGWDRRYDPELGNANTRDLIQILQFLQGVPDDQLTERDRALRDEIPKYLAGATGMQDGGSVADYMGPPGLQSTAPGSDPAYLEYLPEPVQEEMPEEAGMGSVFWDKLTGDDPTEGLRESARIGGSRTAALYGSDPSFMERLITEYNYPAVMDQETGQMVIPTGSEPESVRMARPRHDMPTYPELEDARGHMLGSAIAAQEYGPETAEAAGTFNEFLDRFAPFPLGGQNERDVAMDQRNNAVGRQIFMKAGINATPQQLTQMVDAEIFRQLDVIMGRSPEEQFTPAPSMPRAPRNFVSPPTGPDVYFPRNEQGYFDTTRQVLGFSPRKYRNYQ